MTVQDTQDAYVRYRTGLTINLLVVAMQIGVLIFAAQSLALFEDMAHGVADNLILIGATIVLYFEAHGATPNKGRRRIIALFGGLLLICAGIAGGYVAYERISGAQIPIAGWALAVTSLIACIGGGCAFKVIHGVQKSQHDHLHQSAVAHLVGDLAISVIVFFSALGILYFNLPAIDSYVTLALIAPWMIFRGFQVLRFKDPHEHEHAHTDNHEHHH